MSTMYSTVYHDVRRQFHLSGNDYFIVDLVHRLSYNPDSPVPYWCSMSRGDMADALLLSKRTVQDIVKRLASPEIGLLARDREDNLQSTPKWIAAIGEAKKRSTDEQTGDAEISASPSGNVDFVAAYADEKGVQKFLHGGAESAPNIYNKDNKKGIEVNTPPISPKQPNEAGEVASGGGGFFEKKRWAVNKTAQPLPDRDGVTGGSVEAVPIPYPAFLEAYGKGGNRLEAESMWNSYPPAKQWDIYWRIDSYRATVQGERERYQQNPAKWLKEETWMAYKPQRPQPPKPRPETYAEMNAGLTPSDLYQKAPAVWTPDEYTMTEDLAF